MLQQLEQRRYVSLTAKALRVDELVRDGSEFDDALAIADREYTSDGMSLTQVGEAAAQMEVHA